MRTRLASRTAASAVIVVLFLALVLGASTSGLEKPATEVGGAVSLDAAKAEYVTALTRLLKTPGITPEVRYQIFIELARAGNLVGWKGIADIRDQKDPLSGFAWAVSIGKVLFDEKAVDNLLGSGDKGLRLTGVVLAGEMAAADIDRARLDKVSTEHLDEQEERLVMTYRALAREWRNVAAIAKLARDGKTDEQRLSARTVLGQYVGKGPMTAEEFKTYLEAIVKSLP